jgi:molybdate transport system ATP-binding protein
VSLLMSLDLVRDNFNLSVHTAIATKGFTAIYGHSGSGKTSLLRWIAGLEKNIRGHLTFENNIWQDDKNFMPSQQRQIAYVFQDARLFPHLNVLGNLNFSYQRRFNDEGLSLKHVIKLLELDTLLHRSVAQLSGGEQQRVAIARALLSSPQLILMDEPLGSLDSASKERILKHLHRLHEHLPVPVIYVSHDIEEVSRLAEQLIMLEQGKIIAQGSLIDLSSRLDLNLSHEENAASIISATLTQQDDDYQLSQLLIDKNLPLWLTKINGCIGQRVKVRIPARDISITLHQPEQSSILNILPAIIDDIEQTQTAKVLIRLKIAKQFLLVRLTRKSVDRLKLSSGQAVYAQIKTVALLSEKQPFPSHNNQENHS